MKCTRHFRHKFLKIKYKLNDFLYLISERGEGWEKKGEKHQWLPLKVAQTGDQTYNAHIYPDPESNQ